MSYLGLVPCEHSSGGTTRRGSITKTGNTHARTALVEASWQYRLKPRVSRIILLRQEKLPKEIKDIAWKRKGESSVGAMVDDPIRLYPRA
jgi:transposase